MSSSPRDDLARAEARADIQIRTLTDTTELDDARRVFDRVWPSADGSTQVPPNLLRAQVHAGGYVSGAYADGQCIGAAYGFVGRHRVGTHWHGHLHSHMAAVLEPYRNRHVGAALKLHQRVWALGNDIDTIVWTFDPLVRRNAVLNLLKLGVDVEGFEVNFYGDMDDGINSGDPTDRLFAWWRLTSAKVAQATSGGLARLDIVKAREVGRDVREIDLPADIVELRASDPAAAARWRVDLRAQLLDSFAEDYSIVGLSLTDGYVLERTP